MSLNPHAQEFVPFRVVPTSTGLDLEFVDDVDFHSDPVVEENRRRTESQVLDELLWARFHASDDSAEPPSPCNCHDLPVGSCPSVKEALVERILHGLQKSGLTPNMDGLRQPLQDPSFPVEVWRSALHGYFDQMEIVNGMEF